MPLHRRFATAAWLITLLLSGGATAQDAGPVIPAGEHAPVTYGPSGSTVAVVEQQVWDLKKGETVATLGGTYDTNALRAIDSQGKWFAVAGKSPNQENTPVAIWSLATGEREFEIPGKAKQYVDVLAFCGKHLALGGRQSGLIELWDLDAKKVAKSVTLPYRRLDTHKVAFSPDGQTAACVAHDKVIFCNMANGKLLASGAPPRDSGPPRPGNVEAIFVYTWMSSLSFSPEGKEVAAVSTHPVPRLLTWDVKGKLLLDEPVNVSPRLKIGANLQWLPDGSGWLVGGTVLDRAAKHAVFSVKDRFGSELALHALDRGRLFGRLPSNPTELRLIPIPREQIDVAVKAMNGNEPAHVKPKHAVSVLLEIEGLRGSQSETEKLLADALAKRLARDGITVRPGQEVMLRLKLVEKAGDALAIYERQSPFDRRGRDTGRTATEALGSGVLELMVQGQTKPLWREALQSTSARSFREEINDVTVRKSMLENLVSSLAATDLPYFVPVSDKLLALPVVVE